MPPETLIPGSQPRVAFSAEHTSVLADLQEAKIAENQAQAQRTRLIQQGFANINARSTTPTSAARPSVRNLADSTVYDGYGAIERAYAAAAQNRTAPRNSYQEAKDRAKALIDAEFAKQNNLQTELNLTFDTERVRDLTQQLQAQEALVTSLMSVHNSILHSTE